MKFFTLTNCLITFILGWIFGSIFIFLLLVYQEGLLTNEKFITAFNQPLAGNTEQHKQALKYQRHQQTLMPEQLPQFLLSLEGVDQAEEFQSIESSTVQEDSLQSNREGPNLQPTIIYLYWPYSDSHFSVHQYSALESLLGNFPKATFRITLLPTKAQFQKLMFLAKEETLTTLQNVKIADMIHPRMFEKYRRLDFDIQLSFLTVDELTAIDTDGANEIDPTNKDTDDFNLKNRRKKVQVEQQYLLRYLGVCCDDCEILCFSPRKELLARHTRDHLHVKTGNLKDGFVTTPEVPYHLIIYLHLLLLYKTGGLFSDFSFYFINPLKSTWIHQGYFIHAYCNHIPMTSRRQYHSGRHHHSDFYSNHVEIYYPRLYDNWKELQCYSSTIFYFAQRQNIIAQCLLEKYSIDKVFQICMESDTFFHGANCIKEALDQCLHSINEEKLTLLKKKESIEKRLAVLYASFYPEHHTKIPKFLINSFSDELPDYLSTLHLPETSSQESGERGGTNEAKAAWLELESKTTGLLESFHDNPMYANRTLLATHNWTVSRNTIILWMGHLAWQQIYLSSTYLARNLAHQHHHYYQHHFYPYPPHSLLDVAERRNAMFKRRQFHGLDIGTRKDKVYKHYQCQHYRDMVTIPQYLLQFLIEGNEKQKQRQSSKSDQITASPIRDQNTSLPHLLLPTKSQIEMVFKNSSLGQLTKQNTSVESIRLESSEISHDAKRSSVSRSVEFGSPHSENGTDLTQTLKLNHTANSTGSSVFAVNSTDLPLRNQPPNNSSESNHSSLSSSQSHHYLRGYHSDGPAHRRRLFLFGGKKKTSESHTSSSVFHSTSMLRSNKTMYEFSMNELFLSTLDNSIPLHYDQVHPKNHVSSVSDHLQEFENDLHCNPSIFVIGFPFAASPALLNQLREHPIILSGYDRIYFTSFGTGEDNSRETVLEGCYNSILPNHHFYHRNSNNSTTTTKSDSMHRFSRSSCYPFLHQNESFILLDTSLRYSLNPFTPFLIRQDHTQAKFIFFVENPVHRLMKHSQHYCSRLTALGVISMDSFLISFIEDFMSPLAEFRRIVDEYLDWKESSASSTTDTSTVSHHHHRSSSASDWNEDSDTYDINHIIEYYYLQLSLTHYYNSGEKESFEQEKASNNEREKQRIGFDLFLSSIYFPSLYHYLDLFPMENILIINDEDYQLEQQQVLQAQQQTRSQNRTLEESSVVLQALFEFLHLPSSQKTTKTSLIQAESQLRDSSYSYERVLKELSDLYGPQANHSQIHHSECDVSIDVYNQLVHYFLPFNLLLEQYLNFSIVHWYDDYDKSNPNFRPFNLVRRENETPLSPLWFEVKDTENTRWKKWKEEQTQRKWQQQQQQNLHHASDTNHKTNVVGKLLPQRNSEEDNSFNTTLGMLNTF